MKKPDKDLLTVQISCSFCDCILILSDSLSALSSLALLSLFLYPVKAVYKRIKFILFIYTEFNHNFMKALLKLARAGFCCQVYLVRTF